MSEAGRLARVLIHSHGKQLIDLLFDLRRRRYGTSHGVGLLQLSLQDLREPTPSPRRLRRYLQHFWDATDVWVALAMCEKRQCRRAWKGQGGSPTNAGDQPAPSS